MLTDEREVTCIRISSAYSKLRCIYIPIYIIARLVHIMKYIKTKALEAVIFDWAGSTIDFGCFAPTQVFVDAFAAVGIEISLVEARGPMGMAKIDHIRALLADDTIRERWEKKFGSQYTVGSCLYRSRP